MWELSVPPAQFFCNPKWLRKGSLLLIKQTTEREGPDMRGLGKIPAESRVSIFRGRILGKDSPYLRALSVFGSLQRWPCSEDSSAGGCQLRKGAVRSQADVGHGLGAR